MKKLWMLMCIMTGLALVVGACGTAAVPPTAAPQQPAAEVPPVTAPDVPAAEPTLGPVMAAPTTSDLPVVTAVKVASIPPIDANWAPPDLKSDLWKDAPVTQIGGMQWRAIYSDDTLSIYNRYPDPEAQISGSMNYSWDAATKTWSQADGIKAEYIDLAWFMQDSEVAQQGCDAFCHEDPPGSGQMHHSVIESGVYVDSWMFGGKHGWTWSGDKSVTSVADYGLAKGPEERFWFMGNIAAKQDSPLIFNTNNKDPRQVVAGNITLVDYAEDNVIAPKDGHYDLDRSQVRDQYCINCHATIGLPYNPLAVDFTFPDAGEVKYSANWDVPYTSPKYMETKPVDFIDAMVMTQAEVNNGEAVLIADLTPEKITEYWNNYQAVNGLVPPNVLKPPSASQADVLVGMNWKDGFWTVEFQRKLVTSTPESDVQFSDLTKNYYFTYVGTSIHMDAILGDLLTSTPGILRFEQ